MDMPLKIGPEILECALQWFHGTGRERAKSISRCVEFGLKLQPFQVFGPPLSFFHCAQHPFSPMEPAPAGRAPAAGLLREETFQVPHHADRTGLIVQDNHGAGAHPAASFLDLREVHAYVQMFLGKKIGRSAPRKQTSKLHAVAHSTRVFLQQLSDGRTHGQFP